LNTIIKLIARFVGNRCVTFDGSRVYYWKVPMIVLPMESLAYIQHRLESEFGPDTRKIIYYLGKVQGKNGTNILIQKYNFKPNPEDLSFFMEQTEFVGIGKWTLDKQDTVNCRYIVKTDYSTNADAYANLYGKRDKPICDYVRGLFAGGFQAGSVVLSNLNEDLDAVEITCKSKGDEFCTFEMKKISEWNSQNDKPNEELFINCEILSHALEKETLPMLLRSVIGNTNDPSTDLSAFISKFTGERQFNFEKKGVVSVLGLNALITPIDIIEMSYYIFFKKYGPTVSSIYYESGRNTSKKMTENLFQQYNLSKNKMDHIKMAFEQIGLIGLGKVEITRFDSNSHKYSFRLFNSPGTHYKQLFGNQKEPVDFFVAGFFSGVLEYIYGLEFQVIETNCVVSGSTCCLFSANKK
jgi:predicted hydrocarbon binding protein